MSPRSYLRTSDLAKAAGIHVNTVRLYEQWGLIPPAERTPKGYRRFTQRHLECLRLARLIYGEPYPGKALRRLGQKIIAAVVEGDMPATHDLAQKYQRLVSFETAMAESAAAELERWARHGSALEEVERPLLIGQAAERLGVTIDMLRNWERNGLLSVPRDPYSGYRHYRAPDLARLRIIRLLSRSGYSIMAILRMLLQLDAGQAHDLRAALDTPRPDEDIFTAFDRWLTTLEGQKHRAEEILAQINRIDF